MADFIEFIFDTDEDTRRAEQLFPVDFLHLDALTLAYDAESDELQGIKDRLSEAKIRFTTAASAFSREDVFPD